MSDTQPNATFKNPEAEWAVGQLRHLYRQLLAGEVRDQRAVAVGLLGPAIEKLEPLTTPQALFITTPLEPNACQSFTVPVEGCCTTIIPAALAPDVARCRNCGGLLSICAGQADASGCRSI